MKNCNSLSTNLKTTVSFSMPKFQYNDEIVYGHKRVGNNGRPRCSVHQCRIKVKLKAWIIEQLGGKDNLYQIPEEINNFEELYDHIKELLGTKIGCGIGLLALYDISLRLGSTRNIYPQKYVYLHAAPLESAKHLKSIGLIKVNKLSYRVETSVFNKISGGLASADIEQVLCCYKKEIHKFTSTNFTVLKNL